MFSLAESNAVKLNQGDPGWFIPGDLCMTSRAGIEISPDCPKQYAQLLHHMISEGWIRPVAYVKKTELIFDMLRTE